MDRHGQFNVASGEGYNSPTISEAKVSLKPADLRALTEITQAQRGQGSTAEKGGMRSYLSNPFKPKNGGKKKLNIFEDFCC